MKSIHKTIALCLLLTFGVTFIVGGVTSTMEEKLLPASGDKIVIIMEKVPMICMAEPLLDKEFEGGWMDVLIPKYGHPSITRYVVS